MLLKNKTAVVTGCNRGIGKKILEVFSANGATIFACVRNITEEFKAYLNEIKKNFNNLEKRFSKILTNSIKNYWTDENQNKLKLQRESINATYSWDVRSVEWKNFFDEARGIKG